MRRLPAGVQAQHERPAVEGPPPADRQRRASGPGLGHLPVAHERDADEGAAAVGDVDRRSQLDRCAGRYADGVAGLGRHLARGQPELRQHQRRLRRARQRVEAAPGQGVEQAALAALLDHEHRLHRPEPLAGRRPVEAGLAQRPGRPGALAGRVLGQHPVPHTARLHDARGLLVKPAESRVAGGPQEIVGKRVRPPPDRHRAEPPRAGVGRLRERPGDGTAPGDDVVDHGLVGRDAEVLPRREAVFHKGPAAHDRQHAEADQQRAGEPAAAAADDDGAP